VICVCACCLGRRLVETNQRLLWDYLPQHDPSFSSIPPLDLCVEESVAAVGKYVIHATIGEGQYAAVYACSKREEEEVQEQRSLKMEVLPRASTTTTTNTMHEVDGDTFKNMPSQEPIAMTTTSNGIDHRLQNIIFEYPQERYIYSPS
jgi:hypothetical protein